MNGGTNDSQIVSAEAGWNPMLRLCLAVVVIMLLMMYVTALGVGAYLLVQAIGQHVSLASPPTPLSGVWWS
jgi:hypothetical protein